MFYVLGAHGWMLHGACRQADPELFFPVATRETAGRQIESAKAVCAPCPVRADCLSYALEVKAEGIWGGTTQQERHGGRRYYGRRARFAAAHG
jgi:WhiB family transcriptional regulator, redox-sensing transcriptional regulator